MLSRHTNIYMNTEKINFFSGFLSKKRKKIWQFFFFLQLSRATSYSSFKAIAHQNSWETQASRLHPSSSWKGMTQVSQMSGRNTTNVKPLCNHAPLTCTGHVKVQGQWSAGDEILFLLSTPLPPSSSSKPHTHFFFFILQK